MKKPAKSPAKGKQAPDPKRKKGLGPLVTVGGVAKALARVIREMYDGTIDDQKGARIANALGIQRTVLADAEFDPRLKAMEKHLGLDKL